MASLHFSGAASSDDIEMTERVRDVFVSDQMTTQMYEKDDKKKSFRKAWFLVGIIIIISAISAFVILGILYLPEPIKPPLPKGPEPLPFCTGTIAPNTSASAHFDCPRLAASVAYDISKVRLFFPGNRTILNASLLLSESFNITMAGQWTIGWSMAAKQLTVAPVLGTLTCNSQGMYLFEYLNSLNSLVYYQRLSLMYLGNLEDVRISAQPYLKENGVDKSVFISCSMKTGCRHGIIVPEFKMGEDTSFIPDMACSYSFNISEGGEAICTADIDADVWTGKDEVICSLKSDDEVHKLVKPGQVNTTISDLTNYCTSVSFTIGETGYINCKKRIHGDVSVVLERKGYYFGDWTTLLTLPGEGSKKALDDRLTFTAMKNADIMEINITISEVHCDDKGHLALNYSDGSRTDIKIEVTSDVPPSCPGYVTRSLHPSNNFILICSWCPGHDVKEVLVVQTKMINNSITTLPLFPIPFNTEHQDQNLKMKFSQEYGVMRVDINRFKGVGCNDGGNYTITLRSPSGSSTKSIHVNITVPESMYNSSMTDAPVVAGRNLEIEFTGFIGCAVNNLTARQDGVPLLAKQVTVLHDDIRDAQAFKISWSYQPVTSDIDNTNINATVSFVPLGETTPKSYTRSKTLIVLEDSICTDKRSCNVVHPSDVSKFIACNSAGRIEAVISCPADRTLVYPDPTNCLGQCG